MAQDPESPSLTVGRVLAPWGIRGEVKVQVLTDFPEHLAPKSKVCLKGHSFTIERSRCHDKHAVVKLAEIDDRSAAEMLRGCELEIPFSQAQPLPEGEYYPLQLIGLNVQTTEGQELGQVVDIMATGSNDVYVVRGPHGEVLVPAIADVVESIDLEKRLITIRAIAGLLE